MATSFGIGDFARATHLSVKALRHYHREGLLEPAEISEPTGYRRYTIDQIPIAQIIRRFRDLEMPLAGIRAVLAAPDIQARNALIASHLGRLEETLARSARAAASLRNLLEHPKSAALVERRKIEATPAAAISACIDLADAMPWFRGALAEIQASLRAQRLTSSGVPGAIFSSTLFSQERGNATIFIPCSQECRRVERITSQTIPAAEIAIITRYGAHADIDLAYGSLADYVMRHALAIEGPIREYYVIGPLNTDDDTQWQTEIGWPIFETG